MNYSNCSHGLTSAGVMLVVAFSFCITLQLVAQSSLDTRCDPRETGSLLTRDLLGRQDFMMYESEHCTAVHYAEVCAAFGAARLAALVGDTTTMNRLSARYRRVIDENIPNTANHVDANVYGILPLELFMHTGDSIFLRQGLQLADRQWKDSLYNGLSTQSRVWIDDVWMIASLQVQAYRVTGQAKYLDRAAITAAAYLKRLQQDNGLFYHGQQAQFFWGRGNGWVAAGLAELLSVLPEDHADRESIVLGYRQMMQTLLEYQADDGMWRQLVDKEEAWKETSSTAMFAYALQTGINHDFLDREAYAEPVQKAWDALCGYITPEGQVTQVCVGTGQSSNINYYFERPTSTGDFHGQAPLLWLAYSILVSNK
jgi:unsaturated rhamnogalacturonyl hydrolase